MDIRVRLRPDVKGLIPRLKNFQQFDREAVVIGRHDVGHGEIWGIRFLGLGNFGPLKDIYYFKPDQLIILMEGDENGNNRKDH